MSNKAELKTTTTKLSNSVQDLIRQGISFGDAKLFSAAVSCLRDALKKDPDNIEALSYLADAYIAQDNLQEAADTLNQLMEKDPENENKWGFKIAKCYIAGGVPEVGLVLLMRIVIDTPDDREVLTALGSCYHLMGQYGEASESFELALRQYDSPPNALISSYCGALIKNNETDKALSYLDEAFKKTGSNEIKHMQAVIHFHIGNIDQSLVCVEQIMDSDPPHDNKTLSDALALAASMLMKHEQYDRAVPYFRRIIDDPLFLKHQDQAYILNALGVCYSRLDQKEDAHAAFKKAFHSKPSDHVIYTNYLHSFDKIKNPHELINATRIFRDKMRDSIDVARLYASRTDPKPLLMEASVDLKLTTDSQIKIIEINNLYMSGFSGYKRAYGIDMMDDNIEPYHDELAEELTARFKANPKIDIVTPQWASNKTIYYCNAVWDNKNVYSGSVAWHAAESRKDYLHLTTPVKYKDMFPGTLVIARDEGLTPSELKRRLERLYDAPLDESQDFILKPCNDSVGNGVELVNGKDIVARLHEITSRTVAEDDYWQDNLYPNVIVQECVRSKPVEADNGNTYDGTMRIAFTAVVSPDRKTVESIRFHGGYWKLPSQPIDHEDRRNAIVSFPPHKLSKIANSAFRDSIPVSAKVSDDDYDTSCRQLETWLRGTLPSYAQSPDKTKAQVLKMLSSRYHNQRALGIELATSFSVGTTLQHLCGSAQTRLAFERATTTLNPPDAATVYLYTMTWPDRNLSSHIKLLVSRDNRFLNNATYHP
ncbi:MAG: tetratricopeptide repeat protein [Rhodospirillales bacterium]|nr:tetratricopeptide repeat protein [Rhodospirillales bacterium]MCB9995940.1 tetratricopeptide repeat protein [Rhodospirillales bacterium]